MSGKKGSGWGGSPTRGRRLALRVGRDLLEALVECAGKASRGLSDYVRGVLSRHVEGELRREVRTKEEAVEAQAMEEVEAAVKGGSRYKGAEEGKR